MSENTKLILAFLVGVVVGILGATSTLFKAEPEPSQAQVVARDADRGNGGEAGQAAARSTQSPAPDEQAEPEPAPAESVAQAEEPQPEPGVTRPEQPAADAETAQQGGSEDSEALPTPEPEAEERIFCMQVENSGQCRCYEAETMASVDMSAEECRSRLAEE